jgi:hypothetical protein
MADDGDSSRVVIGDDGVPLVSLPRWQVDALFRGLGSRMAADAARADEAAKGGAAKAALDERTRPPRLAADTISPEALDMLTREVDKLEEQLAALEADVAGRELATRLRAEARKERVEARARADRFDAAIEKFFPTHVGPIFRDPTTKE